MSQANNSDDVFSVGGPSRRRVRWKRTTLLGSMLLLAVAGATAAVIVARRPRPAITTMFRVEGPRSIYGEDRAEQEGGADPIVETYCQLLTSNNVLATTVAAMREQDPGWAKDVADPLPWLRDRIRVKRIPGTWLIAVSAPGFPTDQQAPMLEAFTHAMQRQMRLWQDALKSSVMVDVRERHAGYQKTLAQRRAAVREAIASGSGPEVVDPLRDAVAVSEEISRRLGVAAEELEIESRQTTLLRVVMQAQLWTDPD